VQPLRLVLDRNPHDNSNVTQVSELSPELARGVLQLARALLAAARNWTLYPPEHPAVGQSIKRLTEAVQEVASGAIFAIGVTPDTLLVEGVPADRGLTAVSEAAAFLHERDLLHLAFISPVPEEALLSLLKVLTVDAADRRERGGPAGIWAVEGHPSIVIQQVDYKRVLEREESGGAPPPEKRDDLWQSIVMSIAGGQKALFDEQAQYRLLAIAGNPIEIAQLATAVSAPKCTMDGSPMLTSQAAAVLAAFRHLTNIVSVMTPDRMPDVMNNLATAATQLDPHVVMQVLQSDDDPAAQVSVVKGVAAAFDDVKVAQLLATALALDGQASDRLATIFNTIAPDEDRKRRVMTLTRNMLGETNLGRSNQFQVLWSSMEELLVSYNDKPFVSAGYRAVLDGIGERAERLAAVELPPELKEWMTTLGQENVRSLSVQLLIDLLALEEDEARAASIASDMEALAEDLLMSGAYGDAKTVTIALSARAERPKAIGRDGCRQALDQLGESLAMREAVLFIGEVDDATWEDLRKVISSTGPSTIEALKPLVMVEHETPVSKRAADLIVSFKAAAVPRLASLVGDSRWFVQRAAAKLLGRIAVPEAVPVLQPLLRKTDARVTREAVQALGCIDDPAAARALHTVMRTASGELRNAVAQALVADRDPRVVPMLARIIEESQPLGKDHEVVLEAVGAIGMVGSETGVAPVVKVLGCRSIFRRKKVRALRERGVEALKKIGGPRATSALDEASRTGDRMLRKIVSERYGSA
jgi:HEAT repeat protein